MAGNVTNELLLEHMKRMQDRMGRVEDTQVLILEELRSHKQLIAGALGGQSTLEARTASVEARLDRVEGRLEIREQ